MPKVKEIVGVVPGAGKATRIAGFYKQLTPLMAEGDPPSRIIVSSEQILLNMKRAGVELAFFVVCENPRLITDYYLEFPNKQRPQINWIQQVDRDTYPGMAFAIDDACRAFGVNRAATVVLGMPDTLIEPNESFEILVEQYQRSRADLQLGLYKTRPGSKGGYVEFDARTHRVKSHADKDRPGFPGSADNSWAIACWGESFTRFLHGYVQEQRETFRTHKPKDRELIFGDAVDAAIARRDLTVCADFIDLERGYYLDITDFNRFVEAVRHYSFREEERDEILTDFGSDDLARIRSHLSELRTLVAQSPCFPQDHRDRLLKRLDGLERELNERMFRFERILALLADIWTFARRKAIEAEPILTCIEKIMSIITMARANSFGLPGITSNGPRLLTG